MNTQQIINIAQHLLDEGGVDNRERAEWSFYPDYSGRAMFGSRCLGITCPHGDAYRATAAFVEALKSEGLDGEAETVRTESANFDSMGLDQITYWPLLATPADFDQQQWAEWEDRQNF